MQQGTTAHNVLYVGDWVINTATGALVQIKAVPTGFSDVAVTDMGEAKLSDLQRPSPMTVQEVAEAVYAIIGDERNWTKGALARTVEGTKAFPDDDDAVCWCLVGALRLVTNDKDPIVYQEFQDAWCEHVSPAGMSYVNDVHGHQAVLSGLDKLRSL